MCSSHELADVESSTGDGQQADRGEDREASAHVVGDDKRGVTFLVGAGACGAFLRVGDSHDDLLCLLFASLCFALLLQQAEGEGCLGCGARLGYVDDTKLLVFEIVAHLGEIVFADVVSCKEYGGILLVAHEPCEGVAKSLNHCPCTEVAAADACHYNNLAVVAQHVSASLELADEVGGNR